MNLSETASADAADAAVVAMGAGVPLLVWGPPGIGKTSMIRSMAQSMGLSCEIVILSIRESTDLAGLPVRSGDGVTLVPPDWALRLAAAGSGVLFLDELTTAPPSVQASGCR